jgi:hypothetical protein
VRWAGHVEQSCILIFGRKTEGERPFDSEMVQHILRICRIGCVWGWVPEVC